MLGGFFFVSKRIKMYIIHGTFMVQEFYAGFYNPLYRNFGAFVVRICYNNKNGRLPDVNCTPFVRQYDILSNKWGVLLCQKEYQTNDIRQNSKSW